MWPLQVTNSIAFPAPPLMSWITFQMCTLYMWSVHTWFLDERFIMKEISGGVLSKPRVARAVIVEPFTGMCWSPILVAWRRGAWVVLINHLNRTLRLGVCWRLGAPAKGRWVAGLEGSVEGVRVTCLQAIWHPRSRVRTGIAGEAFPRLLRIELPSVSPGALRLFSVAHFHRGFTNISGKQQEQNPLPLLSPSFE